MFTYKAMNLYQFWKYTYKDLCTQPTKLKFTELNVHLQRCMFTWKVYVPFKYRVEWTLGTKLYSLIKMNAHLKLNKLNGHFNLANSSQNLYNIFSTDSDLNPACKSHIYFFNMKRAYQENVFFAFEITCMIKDQIALRSVQIPLLILLE